MTSIVPKRLIKSWYKIGRCSKQAVNVDERCRLRGVFPPTFLKNHSVISMPYNPFLPNREILTPLSSHGIDKVPSIAVRTQKASFSLLPPSFQIELSRR